MTRIKVLGMAVALGIAALLVLNAEQAAPPFDDPSRLLADVAAESIQSLALIVGGKSVGIERASLPGRPESRYWEMRKPAGARADQKVVDQIIGLLLSLRKANTISEAEQDADLSVYGLVPPEMLVNVSGTFGRIVFSLGKEVAVTERRYAQFEGTREIFLLDSPVVEAIIDSADRIRSVRPFEFEPDVVDSIAIANFGAALFLLKRGADRTSWEGSWGERKFPVDSELIKKQVDELLEIRAKGLFDPEGTDLAIYGLLHPSVVLGLVLDGPDKYGRSEYSAQFGRGASFSANAGAGSESQTPAAGIGYFLKLAEERTVYELSGRKFSFWMQHPDGFRRRNPFAAVQPSSLTSLSIGRSDKAAVLLTPSANGGWSCQRSGAETIELADTTAVANWISKLLATELVSYFNPAAVRADELGLVSPEFEARLKVEGSTNEFYLRVGSPIRLGVRGADAAAPVEPAADTPRYAEIVAEDGHPALGILSALVFAELLEAIPSECVKE